jgi:hypothetical protein
MAIAALPLLEPLIEKYGDPEEAIKALESAAAEARSLTHKIAHATSLTEKEQYLGWLPLLVVLFRVWQTFLGPQVEFTVQAQIGVAKALNHFGANIDTTGLEKVLANIQRSITPFSVKPTASPGPSPEQQVWEVSVL